MLLVVDNDGNVIPAAVLEFGAGVRLEPRGHNVWLVSNLHVASEAPQLTVWDDRTITKEATKEVTRLVPVTRVSGIVTRRPWVTRYIDTTQEVSISHQLITATRVLSRQGTTAAKPVSRIRTVTQTRTRAQTIWQTLTRELTRETSLTRWLTATVTRWLTCESTSERTATNIVTREVTLAAQPCCYDCYGLALPEPFPTINWACDSYSDANCPKKDPGCTSAENCALVYSHTGESPPAGCDDTCVPTSGGQMWYTLASGGDTCVT